MLMMGDLGRSIWVVGTMPIYECSLLVTGGEDSPAPETNSESEKEREGDVFVKNTRLKELFVSENGCKTSYLIIKGAETITTRQSRENAGASARVPRETGLSVKERV